jgi:hypothetical protein
MSQARCTNLQPPCVEGVLTPPVWIFYGKHGFKKNKNLLHYLNGEWRKGVCVCWGGGGGGRVLQKSRLLCTTHVSEIRSTIGSIISYNLGQTKRGFRVSEASSSRGTCRSFSLKTMRLRILSFVGLFCSLYSIGNIIF